MRTVDNKRVMKWPICCHRCAYIDLGETCIKECNLNSSQFHPISTCSVCAFKGCPQHPDHRKDRHKRWKEKVGR